MGDERRIAIVGMACRFPGADDPATYWQNLRSGTESVTFFSEEDLRAAGISEVTFRNPNYVPAAPLINGADLFDASFFEYSPREASLMDPSHRLFLEVAWEAFEDAGILPGASGQVAGVFAGAGGVVTSYLVDRFSSGNASVLGPTGGLEHLGNDKDFLATRASFKLNLKGPSITVQTACSTSLVALHLACQSILSGECDLALAGGATVRCPQTAGYLSRSGDILSPDGHCRAFDAEAQGTIFGSGVGAVLLQPLEQAVAAGARIYAVIRGTAINNDGAEKISYTASSVAGQSRAMVEALTLAEADAESISYVECHGTGTILGDPLEIQALSRAFRVAGGSGVRSGDGGPWCGIGSVKSNIGHLEQAAGVAAVIKTALALFHREIPPTLNFQRPNPKINLTTSPFYVATALHPWAAPHDLPRRACVNSLGLGGTNAFAVMEEPPEPPRPKGRPDRPLHLFTMSGKDRAALDASAARYRERLPALRHAHIGDICHTAAAGRVHFPARYAAVVGSVEDLERALAQYEAPADPAAPAGGKGPVFLFTGQGSQYGAMASGLYEAHPVFRKALDRCNTLLSRDLQPGLLDVLYDPRRQHLVDTTAYTQPVLVALQYALAELWRSWGVVPAAVMGHSIGEYAAACVAGAMGLEDTLRLVARRGAMMDRIADTGSMVAVQADEAALETLLALAGERVCIAASNAPLSSVIAGDAEAVGTVVAQLEASSVPHRALRVSQAFHSPLIEPILD
ncbi:MAG TPA: type I polyketide synthase, partial [Actinomycetota bacterium]|nr:type I polyketide synthase [Actinomycetota bacterium]